MWLYRTFTTLGPPLTSVYFRLGLDEPEAPTPASGPVVVVANHSSFLDPWFIAIAYPLEIRYLMTERWFYRSWLWERFFRGCGTVPVHVDDPAQTFDAACGVLARGENLGIFPEGKISQDGRMQRFRSGFARIAAHTGVPVVPLGIRGAFEALPRDRRLPKPRRVRIVAGTPRRFPGAPLTDPAPSALRTFVGEIFEDVRRLAGRDSARASRPAGTGA